MPKPDHALQTAIELLADTVCRCGHLCSDHAGSPFTERRLRVCGAVDHQPCECDEFRPVRFTVERAQ